MGNKRSSILIILVTIFVAGVILGVFWVNYRLALQSSSGNDFLSPWVGTRYFLLNGWSPYSNQTSEMIQNIASEESADLTEDKLLFVYPFYSVLLFAPFGLIGNFAIACGIWMTVLQLVLLLIAGLSLTTTKWRPQNWLLPIIFVFSILWYHGLKPAINGNASIFVALFIILAFVSIRNERDIAGGIWLAMSTIKPQMVVFIIPLVIIWTISKRRWMLVVSFLSGMGILVVVFSLLIPNWILQYLNQILNFPESLYPGTPGEIFAEWIPGVGKQLGWLMTLVFSLVLIVEWRAVIKKDFYWFIWAACLTLVFTNLIGIRTGTENYIAMFPAVILVFSLINERWGKNGDWMILLIIMILLAGVWVIYILALQKLDQQIRDSLLFFPVPIYLVMALYWLRWWAIRPPRVFIDQIHSLQD